MAAPAAASSSSSSSSLAEGAPAVRAEGAVADSLAAMLLGKKAASTAATATAAASSKAAPSSSASSSTAAATTAAAAAPVAVTFSLPSSLDAQHPLLEVRELAGRGRGFVAREAIEAGTLLLTETSIYAHAAHCNSSEEARIQALAALTRIMAERYPQALQALCHHPDHELPEHSLIDASPLPDLDLEQWHAALARVDSNCFTSSRGMMCSPAVSTCNHSCYPNADLIIREVEAEAGADADASNPKPMVEQCFLYALSAIAAGEEVTINYLGSDSLCRWYAPTMIRRESFESQWQFVCKCARCEGGKARAIDKTISYTPNGLDERLEADYTRLVLSEQAATSGPDPHQLLQLYRDIFKQFDGERFYYHYLLHQLRSMLIFMPAAFDGAQPPVKTAPKSKSKVKGKDGTVGSGTGGSVPSSSSSSAAPGLTGEAEWLQLVEHHLLTLRSNLLQPPLHSIKSDTIDVLLRSSDFIGADFAAVNEARTRAGQPVQPNTPLRRKVVDLANETDEVFFDDPTFAKLYPDTFRTMQQLLQPTD